MTQTVLHVVFTPSGAGCLAQALRNAGRDDQVIASFDDMSFGPINPSDSSLRANWVENELGRTDWNEIAVGSERLSDEARFPDNRNSGKSFVRKTRRCALLRPANWCRRQFHFSIRC